MGVLKWWCSKFGHGSPVLEPYGIIRCMRCREVLCDLVKALNMKQGSPLEAQCSPEEPSHGHEE